MESNANRTKYACLFNMFINWDINLLSKEEKEMIVNWANYTIYFWICVVVFLVTLIVMYKGGRK